MFKSPDGWSLYSTDWSVNTLSKMYLRGEIDFESRVQRPEVWTKTKSSKYIHSLLWGMLDYNIPHLYSKHGKTYDSVDGKQRAMTLIRYINNEYQLTGLKDQPINIDGEIYDINGKRFRRLPEKLQEIILDFSIRVVVLEDAPPEVEAEFFERANSGVAVTKTNIAYAKNENILDIAEITSHEIFGAMFRGKKDMQTQKREIVVKSWIALNETDPVYDSSHFNSLASSLAISEEEKNQIIAVYDIIFGAYKIILMENSTLANQILNRTHMLSYIPFMDNFTDSKQLAKWLVKFYTNVPEDYAEACSNHTITTAHINVRANAISQSIEEFLSKSAGAKDKPVKAEVDKPVSSKKTETKK